MKDQSVKLMLSSEQVESVAREYVEQQIEFYKMDRSEESTEAIKVLEEAMWWLFAVDLDMDAPPEFELEEKERNRLSAIEHGMFS